jgi:uncharacterized protein (DUF362 family)
MAATGAVGAAVWTPESSKTGENTAQGRHYDFRVPDSRNVPPVLAISKRASDVPGLVAKAIAAIGGIQKFISPGDVVALKPNIGWDRSPLHAANTNPQVVATVVRLAYEAGAKQVIVTDSSCNDAQRAFDRSGIWKAAYDAGAEVILPAPHKFRVVHMGGVMLHDWPVLSPVIDADKVINLPVAKQHNLARFTGAMKNWYGLLGGRRNRLHQAIDESIADLAEFLRPTFTLMDATRVLVRNGPQGGNVDDTRELHTIVASVDQVAVDAYSSTLIGQKPERIPYLHIAQRRGIGTTDLKRLRVEEV